MAEMPIYTLLVVCYIQSFKRSPLCDVEICFGQSSTPTVTEKTLMQRFTRAEYSIVCLMKPVMGETLIKIALKFFE